MDYCDALWLKNCFQNLWNFSYIFFWTRLWNSLLFPNCSMSMDYAKGMFWVSINIDFLSSAQFRGTSESSQFGLLGRAAHEQWVVFQYLHGSDHSLPRFPISIYHVTASVSKDLHSWCSKSFPSNGKGHSGMQRKWWGHFVFPVVNSMGCEMVWGITCSWGISSLFLLKGASQ